jgi:hypothetical protein
MALLKLKKAVTEEVPVLNTTPVDIAEQIDKVAVLHDQAQKDLARIKELEARVKPYKDELKKLSSLITAHADAEKIDRSVEVTHFGETAGAKAGKKVMTRSVKSQEQAMKLLTKQVYFAKASVPLTVIDQYLTPDQKAELIDINYGDRTVTIIPKPRGMS